jgi:hypothetical protein
VRANSKCLSKLSAAAAIHASLAAAATQTKSQTGARPSVRLCVGLTTAYSNERLIFLFSPFFLAPATTYPHGPHAGVASLSQRRSHRGRGRSSWLGLVLCSAASSPSSNSPLLLPVSAAPLGGAAAAEGQGAVNALDMDESSCGFCRVRRRPPRPRLSRARSRRLTTRRRRTLRRAWCGASLRPSTCRPLRRTTRSSRWRNRPKPTPLAPSRGGGGPEVENVCACFRSFVARILPVGVGQNKPNPSRK